ncbi:Mitochondrial import protein TIM [Heracleum sosnowskyi]|uniref:Mitochondrial import protein TIM n=1 Tax=Heracleum sosnowskyi TaxID=360622 RepID=A0AAD8HWH3_9APIA|nr:Mitochondrial import protein TIM [Heracleum sosnowskyi]
MATTTNLVNNFPAFSSFSPNSHKPISSISCPNSFRPNLGNSNKIFKSCSLKFSQKQSWAARCVMPVSVVSGFDDNAEAVPEPAHLVDSIESAQEASIDLKLPRRSLLVQFTCNICNERSQRLINRLAYEKGTVYVKCAGCSQYHKLVDNLNLVVEYDFREDDNVDVDAAQI